MKAQDWHGLGGHVHGPWPQQLQLGAALRQPWPKVLLPGGKCQSVCQEQHVSETTRHFESALKTPRDFGNKKQKGSEANRHRAIKVFNKQWPLCAPLTHSWHICGVFPGCGWPHQDLVDLMEMMTKQAGLTSKQINLRHFSSSPTKT